MTLLGIDLGTTHLKAGLFSFEGQPLKIVTRAHAVHAGWEGVQSYDPEEFWWNVAALLAELQEWMKTSAGVIAPVQAIGVAGMAETGMLLDAASGQGRTPLIPWFETCALAQAEALAGWIDPEQHFYLTGLRLGYKLPIVKLAWLRDRHPELLPGAMWCSAPDYIAYRLTGELVTDYTLAERTGAFRIANKAYDTSLLSRLELPESLFPQAHPSGFLAGRTGHRAAESGLRPGIPVSVAGHDHVCGAFAVSSLLGDAYTLQAFDSMGTAEALIGEFPERGLKKSDFLSGFSFGLSAVPGYLYWQGGLSTSGGSLDWARRLLGHETLTYSQLGELLASRGNTPTGILYFPYLAGSGSPHSNSRARGAFVGLSSTHTRADLAQAVLEGCAYELEWMRRQAETVTGELIRRVAAAGGGARNLRWLQIKADIFGCAIDVLDQEETSLLGAALLAGLGSEVYASLTDLRAQLTANRRSTVLPDPGRSASYRRLFEEGYQKLESVIQAINLPQV